MDNEAVALLGDLLATINRLERIAYREAETSNSSAYYRTLGALRQFGPQRASRLADYYRISQPAMSRVVAALERDGLIERMTDPADSRASLMSISERGDQVYEDRLKSMGRALAPYFPVLTKSDRAILAAAAELLGSASSPRELVGAGSGTTETRDPR